MQFMFSFQAPRRTIKNLCAHLKATEFPVEVSALVLGYLFLTKPPQILQPLEIKLYGSPRHIGQNRFANGF